MTGGFMCWNEAQALVADHYHDNDFIHLAMGGTDTYSLKHNGKQQIIVLDASSQEAISYQESF